VQFAMIFIRNRLNAECIQFFPVTIMNLQKSIMAPICIERTWINHDRLIVKLMTNFFPKQNCLHFSTMSIKLLMWLCIISMNEIRMKLIQQNDFNQAHIQHNALPTSMIPWCWVPYARRSKRRFDSKPFSFPYCSLCLIVERRLKEYYNL
jgi:hypothetical protein